MATQVKHRRGSTSEIENFTPAIGELIVDTTNNDLVLGDGVEQGGKRIPTGGNALKVFDSVSIITSSKTNVVVETKGRVSPGDGGASKYLIVNSVTYNTLTGNSNGPTALGNGGDGTNAYFDIVLPNNFIAYKLKRDVVFTEQLCDISDNSAVTGAFVAAAHASANHCHFVDVHVDHILIEGAPRVNIQGAGTITQTAGSEFTVLACRDTVGRVDIKDITIDGNAANHAAVPYRNDGACLRISGDNGGGFSVVGTKLKNNYSGATLLVIDNAQDTDEVRGPNVIANNQITDAGLVGGPLLSDGMFINSDNTDIYNNDIQNCTDYFIALDYSKNINVTKNRCENGLVAVGVLGVTKCTVQDNTFDTCGLGIAVALSGNSPVDPYVSRDVVITGNTVRNVTRDPSGTPNGDGIFVDPSAINVRIELNYVESAFRGVAASNPNCFVLFNRVRNISDRPYFCSGAGSVIVGNTYELSAGGPFYGNWSDKMIIDGEDNYIVDITSFIGGWSNVGDPFRDAGYRVFYNQQKMVKLYGAVKGGTTSPGQPIFQLPVGARPAVDMRFIVADNVGSAVITVSAAGDVTYQSGAGTEVNLDAVEFEAAD